MKSAKLASRSQVRPRVTGLLLDVARAVIGSENRFCYVGDEPTTTRMRADTKPLTSIVVACLVESAQRGNQVGFRRRGSLSSVKRRHLFRPGKMVMQLFVCKPQEGGTENIHS